MLGRKTVFFTVGVFLCEKLELLAVQTELKIGLETKVTVESETLIDV